MKQKIKDDTYNVQTKCPPFDGHFVCTFILSIDLYITISIGLSSIYGNDLSAYI